METFPPFVVGIFGLGIVGFVGWVIGSIIKSRDDLHRLELKLTHDYVHKDAFTEFRKEFRQHCNLVLQIAGKLGIEVRRD